MQTSNLIDTLVDDDPNGLTAHLYESAGSVFPYLVVYHDTETSNEVWSKVFKTENDARASMQRATNQYTA